MKTNYLNVVNDFVIHTRAVKVDMMNDHLIVLVPIELDSVSDPQVRPWAVRNDISDEWIPAALQYLKDERIRES